MGWKPSKDVQHTHYNSWCPRCRSRLSCRWQDSHHRTKEGRNPHLAACYCRGCHDHGAKPANDLLRPIYLRYNIWPCQHHHEQINRWDSAKWSVWPIRSSAESLHLHWNYDIILSGWDLADSGGLTRWRRDVASHLWDASCVCNSVDSNVPDSIQVRAGFILYSKQQRGRSQDVTEANIRETRRQRQLWLTDRRAHRILKIEHNIRCKYSHSAVCSLREKVPTSYMDRRGS